MKLSDDKFVQYLVYYSGDSGCSSSKLQLIRVIKASVGSTTARELGKDTPVHYTSSVSPLNLTVVVSPLPRT